MKNNIRILFEQEVKKRLSMLQFEEIELKIKNNEIIIKDKKTPLSAKVHLVHLRNAGGYYAANDISMCNALKFCNNCNPPYKSRLYNNSFLYSNSLSHKHPQFGNDGTGIIKDPNLNNLENTVDLLITQLSEFYIERIINCINNPLYLIKDVINHSEDYAFPFLTCIFAIHQLKKDIPEDILVTLLKSDSLFGNKLYDLDQLEYFLK